VDNHETVLEEVRAQAHSLESSSTFPRHLAERVRAATSWMGTGDTAPDEVRFTAALLSRQATRYLEPPAIPGHGLRRLVKLAIRGLVGWYGRFLCQHVAAVGQAFSRLGLAVAERVDRLEAGQTTDRDALQAELDALRARVASLEAALSRNEHSASSAR
jgi:hypothetical protein